MGGIANLSRCNRFISEFQDDILHVYGLPGETWIRGQWLEQSLDGRVEMRIDLRLSDGSDVTAVVGPTFFDANLSTTENVDLLEEAMDVSNGLSRAEIERRMKVIGLISEER